MYPQTIAINWDSSAALSPLAEYEALFDQQIVGLSFCAQSFTGTPTNAIITPVVGGVAQAAAAVTHATAGTPATWKSNDMGGSGTPIAVSKGQVVGFNLTFTAGTSPTAVRGLLLVTIRPGA